MKVICQGSELSDALSKVIRALPVKKTTPILDGVKISAAGDTLVCHLGRQCEGWVRLTLRGMHRGDTLRVNGLTYICSGRTDEQACRRFTTEAFSTIVVTGPKGFSRENVMSVEAIEIERHTRRSPLR